MKNINIPEPCSEDWNKMTPNDKGAFCQKCAKDVYDFTNKSADEIREVLTLNMVNPVCMRIEPQQLDQLNNDFAAWKIQNKQSYDRAWIFTLLVVFGMTLFSCEEDEEPVVKEYQKIGQSILNQEEEKVVDVILPNDVENETAGNEAKSLDMPTVDLDKLPSVMLGTPIYHEKVEGTVLDEVVVLDEAVIHEDFVRIERVYRTAGVPMISPDYNDYLVATYDGVISDSVDFKVDPKITGLAYPNPASNQTTIQLNMPKRGKGEIELFALNGQKIRTIHSGRIKKGENEYLIDLSDLETGMYLVVVQSGKMKETIKFSKILD